MVWWLAQNLLITAVLTVAVALLCRLGRFRPAVRHALWLGVLLKLLTPPGIEWPWPVPDVESVFSPRAVAREEPPVSAPGILPPGDVPELLSEELFAVGCLRSRVHRLDGRHEPAACLRRRDDVVDARAHEHVADAR